MKWYRNLYIDESVKEKKVNRIKWKLNHNAGLINYYIITLASNKENLLDIISTAQLKQKAYPKKDMCVVGLAKGYEQALDLVTKIIQEVLDSTASLDIEKYIEDTGGME